MTTPEVSNFETYQAAWRTGIDPAERERLLKKSVAENCAYRDPSRQAHGYTELLRKIKDSEQKFPGATFRNDQIIEQHRQALILWTMLDGEGNEFAPGASYVGFSEDGRLQQMSGFFGAPDKTFQSAHP